MQFSKLRRHVLPLSACCILGAAGAGPAQAESFEQLTRATGAQGASPFLTFGQPVFVSDTGRWAIVSSRPFYPVPGAAPTTPFSIRDIVANTTRPLGDANVVHVYGVDRAERQALVRRYDAAADRTTLALVRADGGPMRVLRTWPGELNDIEAVLSGDGQTVAVSSLYSGAIPGLYTLSVLTGIVRQLDTARSELGTRSISDDGKVVAGSGAYYRGTSKTATPGSTVVSPNGSTVAAVVRDGQFGPYKVITRRLATGVTRTSPALPEQVADIAWISADGRYLASASTRETQPATPARILDVAAGTWTDLAGPYATSIDYAIGGQGYVIRAGAVSRNGRYAVAGYGPLVSSQFALLDLTGADLPGAQEALSASSYVAVADASGAVRACPGQPSMVSVSFAQSRSWVPVPQRATIRISAGGTEFYDETIEPAATNDDQWSAVRRVEFPATAQSLTYAVSVVDAAGRTVTGSEVLPVQENPYPCEG